MKIRGAIFDADGTLFDSMSVWDGAAEEYLRSLGIEPRENLTERFKNMSMQDSAEFYRDEYGLRLSVGEIIDGVNRLIDGRYKNDILIKPGVEEFLFMLKKIGTRMCIATATDERLIRAALERNGISSYFDRIFTCAEVGANKSSPEIYENALLYLGTNREDTVVFEDSYNAAKTAKRAGFKVAAMYDSTENEQDGLKSISDWYFMNFYEAEVLIK